MIVETPIILDISDSNRLMLTAKQNDSESRYLRVTIRDAGVDQPIPSGNRVTIGYKRPDGSSSTSEGVVNEDGTATILIPATALALAGIVTATVTVLDGSVVLSTCNFRITVESDPTRGTPIPTPGGTTDYNQLDNKPSINGKVLMGDVAPKDIGIPDSDDIKAVVEETVPAWAREKSKPSYNAREVGAVTQGDVHDIIREDVPEWAREKSKPQYKASEVEGAVEQTALDAELTVLREQAGVAMPPVISFVDDDGTTSVMQLHEWMQEHQVPYTFAVSTGLVGNASFLSWSELQTLNNDPLVSFSCHGVHDDVMTEHTAEEMDAIYAEWRNEMAKHGLPGDASTVMYNHGTTDDAIINSVVRKYFKYGFTVHKDVNKLPFERYKMHRVGLFPSDASFTLAQAKAYVDRVKSEGGWLVFFTHCYYDTFNESQLTELVNYIREQKVEIDGVENVVSRYARFIEEDPVDDGEWTEVSLEPVYSRAIAKVTSATPGEIITSTSGANCVATASVSGKSKIQVGGTAYSLAGKISFLALDGSLIKCYWQEDNKSGSNAQFAMEVEVPSGAETVIISGNSGQRLPYLRFWVKAGADSVTRTEFETYKSQVSESITNIQQQIGYAEADLAALLGEVESVVDKF